MDEVHHPVESMFPMNEEGQDGLEPPYAHQRTNDEIVPLQPDTVVMALLHCKQHLPPNSTVEQCIRKYY